jgi:DNA polymerase III alpha subunit
MMDQIKIKLPTIEISDEFVSPTEYLRLIVTQQAEHLGLLDGENTDAYRKRIECEISIFEQCNAIDYLLRVWDFLLTYEILPDLTIRRSMASASLVCYLLDITKFDPVKYGLMFSRFLTDHATSIPSFEFSIGEDLFELRCGLSELGYTINRREDESDNNSISLHKSHPATLIEKTLDYIYRNNGLRILPNDFPLDDAATFNMLNHAHTDGIPHLQGDEIAQTLFELRPAHFEELIPLCAMNCVGVEKALCDYCHIVRHKNSLWWERELHNPPIVIYQEQIMHMALARGFKDFEADQIRKYIGIKQIDKLSVYRQRWIEASDEKSWDLVVNSGLYAFPKAYAIVMAHQAYTCAYLKTHFPEEYTRAAMYVVASGTL